MHRKELLGRVVSEYNAGRAGDESDAIVALSAICAKSHIGEPFIQDVLQLPGDHDVSCRGRFLTRCRRCRTTAGVSAYVAVCAISIAVRDRVQW